MDSVRERYLSEDGEALSNVGQTHFAPIVDAPASTPRPRWYAVRTQPRHEKCVREHLESRRIESFLPLYEKVHRWKNGCQARVKLPLFPGYIFVAMDLRHRLRVLEIPGAISLVGATRGAWPLSDFQIQTLRENLHLRRFEPHEYLTVGQRVRIATGPLADWTGILVRRSAALRVVLALDEIMQGVAVEVGADEVEVIAPSALSAKL